MNLITITRVHHIENHELEIHFSDGCVKCFDFAKIISFKGISQDLIDVEYFKTAHIQSLGRSFGWDNGYDCCADWARYYAPDEQSQWAAYDDKTTLSERIVIARESLSVTVCK